MDMDRAARLAQLRAAKAAKEVFAESGAEKAALIAQALEAADAGGDAQEERWVMCFVVVVSREFVRCSHGQQQ